MPKRTFSDISAEDLAKLQCDQAAENTLQSRKTIHDIVISNILLKNITCKRYRIRLGLLESKYIVLHAINT